MRTFFSMLLTPICLIIFSNSLLSQQSNQSQIGIRFNNLFNKAERINPEYSVEEFTSIVSYTPKVSHGFEGAIFYKKAIGEKWKAGFSLIGGVYTNSHELFLSNEFNQARTDFSRTINRDFDYGYGGLTVSAEYALLSFEKSRLDLRAGLSYLFFIPENITIGRGISPTGQETISYFESSKRLAPEQNGLICPEGGLSYTYTFWQRLSVSGVATVRYSDKLIANGNYELFGDNDNLFARFEQDLFSFNLGIELAYCFKK